MSGHKTMCESDGGNERPCIVQKNSFGNQVVETPALLQCTKLLV